MGKLNLSKRVFTHNKNRPKNRYEPGTLEFEVSEIFYQCALELTSVAYSTINRAYPKQERERNPKTEYLWLSSHAQAKEFLTRYKNIVKDNVIPFAILSKHKEAYDALQDQSTTDFRALVVDNNFYMLYSKLKDFGPLMLPEEHLEAYNKVLETTYNTIKDKLVENMSIYEAAPKYNSEEEYFNV